MIYNNLDNVLKEIKRKKKIREPYNNSKKYTDKIE